MAKKINAPYKGLTVKQYMKKKHPDITILEDDVLLGEFCGFAEGPMTDTGCIHVCPHYSSCDEAAYVGDLACLLGGQKTFCHVCGALHEREDFHWEVKDGKRYRLCGGCEGV